MKAPSLKFDLSAVGAFFMAHGEKIGVAVVGLVALMLAWGALGAVRSRTLSSERRPEVLRQKVEQAEQNIDREKAVPAEMMVALDTTLSGELEPWRDARPAEAKNLALLDRPLFDAATKRTRPDILPIEDLRAVAGVAVIAQPMAPGMGTAMDPGVPGFPTAPEPAPEPGPLSRRQRGRRGAQTPEPMMEPGMEAGMGMMPQGPTERVKVVPYVVVTGLIPAGKQLEEYASRFGNASYQDPTRDAPIWSDFEVDRCEVQPDGAEDWQTVDLNAVFQRMTEWTGMAGETVPPFFMLTQVEQRLDGRTTRLPFCSPVPQRVDMPWGAEISHPWMTAKLRELAEKQAAAAAAAAAAQQEAAPNVFQGQGGFGPGMEFGGGPGMSGPGFAAPGMGPGSGMVEGSGMMPGMAMDPAMMESGMGMPGAQAAAMLPEYRLFRFVDTTVEPGRRYRYRVRVKVWNPNWSQTPEQIRPHLADPAIAADLKLASADSVATAAVRIPQTASLLLAMLPDAERKRMRVKPGTYEVLVMAESGGTLTLRSVFTEVGGFANVDAALNRPGDQRSRGENITTDMLMVDAVGDQLEPPEGRRRDIMEPLEMLFLRPDGSFEHVSAADSQAKFMRYRQQLPDKEDSRRGMATMQAGDPYNPEGSPAFTSPFGQSR
jgi:hypothetical protein